MSSYGPTVPMAQDASSGFTMNDTIQNTINQNLRMLLLTSPGERVMQPEFGVGLTRYLFETFDATVYANIQTRIQSQVATYIPAITISNISFDPGRRDENVLGLTITYRIQGMGMSDSVEV
jgi:phage baseplate assembly protein W